MALIVALYCTLLTVGIFWYLKRRPLITIPPGATLVIPGHCPRCGEQLWLSTKNGQITASGEKPGTIG